MQVTQNKVSKSAKWCKALWILGVVAMAGFVSGTARADKAGDAERTLSVSGQAEVQATPDRARVTLGAEAQEKEADQATARVNIIMNRVLDSVKKLGIASEAIQTSQITLYPVYESLKSGDVGPAKIAAYRATNTVQVTVDNLSLVGKVLDAASLAGANRQHGVNFELKNDAAAKNEALRLAAQDARAKATALANALGLRLGEIKTASENSVNVIMPRPMYGAALYKSAADTPVEAGQLTVQAGVSLIYLIQ